MAKELPYFQFEPAAYLTGDITICSLEAQGLYLNICCVYWQKNCETTYRRLSKRYASALHLLDELIEEQIIKHDVETDRVTISFLDEQWDVLEKRRKINSENGRKGGLARAKATAKANAKATPKHIEENRKEEKRKEEKKSNTITVPNASALSNKLKTIFLKTYLHETGNEFYWGPKEATNLRQLIAKISFSIKEKKEKDSAQKEKEATAEEIVSSFEIILKNLPQWNRENNFSISGINSQYNQILNSIKNGKSELATDNSLQNLFDRIDKDFCNG